jgi:hypothetical protein
MIIAASDFCNLSSDYTSTGWSNRYVFGSHYTEENAENNSDLGIEPEE